MDEMIALIKEKMRIESALEPDTPLLSSGMIDSFHFVDLLYTLEESYDVTINLAEVGIDNFDTPRLIYALIERWIK